MTTRPYLIPRVTRWLGCHRIDLEECGSTNDEAARLAVRNWVPFLPATASPEGLIPMGRKTKKATA